jgi:DNA-binding FadR family transcriptional regulator
MKNNIDPQKVGKTMRTFENVALKIKEMIFQGEIKPGHPLPSETALARKFGVGRQSVREAIRILEYSGIISTQKKGRISGVIVQDNILATISNLFVDAMTYDKIPLAHLTVARLEIEKAVVVHAAKNAEEKDYQALEENIAMARKKILKKQPATEENITFHKLLAESSGNIFFIFMVDVLLSSLRDFIGQKHFVDSTNADHRLFNNDIERSRQVITYHEDILQAIKHENTERAKMLMEEHLLNLQERLLSQ